jgi:quinol monooxygenase YgiN
LSLPLTRSTPNLRIASISIHATAAHGILFEVEAFRIWHPVDNLSQGPDLTAFGADELLYRSSTFCSHVARVGCRADKSDTSTQLPSTVLNFDMDTLILTFPCKPGSGQVLLEAFKTALVETRAYKGCISVTAYTSATNPDDVILIEEWDSKTSQANYMQWRTDTGMPEQLGPLLAGPLKEEWLVPHSI